jgi:uncharacterized C2H2 Zn-finger protein
MTRCPLCDPVFMRSHSDIASKSNQQMIAPGKA